jgi:NDP-sugar pyrophosphorylase family protein
MKAVVLAGGVRSGLEVPGSGLPRALWPFPGKPLITHVLSFLRRSGCDQIAVCANGKTRLIAAELNESGDSAGIHYAEDLLPRGPAGCLRDLADWLGGDTFLAIQGTGSYDFDLNAMIEEHRRGGAVSTGGAAVTVGARRCPDDVDLLEPAGVYMVEPSTLAFIQPTGYQDFKEQFLPKVIAAGLKVRCHCLKGTATLIHSPGHYLSAIREAILHAAQAPLDGYRRLQPDVIVHESARVHPTARLTGPVWVDAGAVVGERSVIAGPVVVGKGARTGSGALVHRTIAMKDSVIGPGAEVFSAVLAPGAARIAQRMSRLLERETDAQSRIASGPLDRLLGFFENARPAMR